MAEEIINRVAKSPLITLELKSFSPKHERVALDIKEWLYKGLILKEKEFRASLKNHNWDQYLNKNVAIYCSSDVIIPNWAYMLVAIKLAPFVKFSLLGSLEELEIALFNGNIDSLEIANFTNKKVLIKGCSETYIPDAAYLSITNKLLPVVNSIMFGEACSNVPLFKKAK